MQATAVSPVIKGLMSAGGISTEDLTKTVTDKVKELASGVKEFANRLPSTAPREKCLPVE